MRTLRISHRCFYFAQCQMFFTELIPEHRRQVCVRVWDEAQTWSALLMPLSRHSRTALLCAAGFPMLAAVSVGRMLVCAAETHISAVLLSRLRGCKRADHMCSVCFVLWVKHKPGRLCWRSEGSTAELHCCAVPVFPCSLPYQLGGCLFVLLRRTQVRFS